MNARMPELQRAFESAGFMNVKTVLSSGNVVFEATSASPATLARKAEAALEKKLGRTFRTIVRSTPALVAMIERDPFSAHRIPAGAKRVVTFLPRAREPAPALPDEIDGARILHCDGAEVFTIYVPNARGPVFMGLIERTFGQELTTRTWDTVKKCAFA